MILPDEVRYRIAAERESGDNLQAIADRLNEDGIHTTRGGGQRWPSTVRVVVRSVELDED